MSIETPIPESVLVPVLEARAALRLVRQALERIPGAQLPHEDDYLTPTLRDEGELYAQTIARLGALVAKEHAI